MTSVWNPSENGGRLQSLDLSRKDQDASLHLGTDVSLRGPRMFTQELGNTQNALFLRTHTHRNDEVPLTWAPGACTCTRTHTHQAATLQASTLSWLVIRFRSSLPTWIEVTAARSFRSSSL